MFGDLRILPRAVAEEVFGIWPLLGEWGSLWAGGLDVDEVAEVFAEVDGDRAVPSMAVLEDEKFGVDEVVAVILVVAVVVGADDDVGGLEPWVRNVGGTRGFVTTLCHCAR